MYDSLGAKECPEKLQERLLLTGSLNAVPPLSVTFKSEMSVPGKK